MHKWSNYFSWIKWPRRLITMAIWVALIGFNILTLTSSAIYAAASSTMAAMGVRSTSRSVLVNQVNSLQGKVTAQRNAVRRMGNRIATRTSAVATRKLATMPAKAIPVAGVAVLVGGTAWEISMLCEELEDLNLLYIDFELDETSALSAMDTVCNPDIPTVADLREYIFGAEVQEVPDI